MMTLIGESQEMSLSNSTISSLTIFLRKLKISILFSPKNCLCRNSNYLTSNWKRVIQLLTSSEAKLTCQTQAQFPRAQIRTDHFALHLTQTRSWLFSKRLTFIRYCQLNSPPLPQSRSMIKSKRNTTVQMVQERSCKVYCEEKTCSIVQSSLKKSNQ